MPMSFHSEIYVAILYLSKIEYIKSDENDREMKALVIIQLPVLL